MPDGVKNDYSESLHIFVYDCVWSLNMLYNTYKGLLSWLSDFKNVYYTDSSEVVVGEEKGYTDNFQIMFKTKWQQCLDYPVQLTMVTIGM